MIQNILNGGKELADEPKLTADQLQAELKSAMALGDIPKVIQLATQLKKLVKGAGDAELEAKKGQITDLGEKVKIAFVKLIDQYGADIVTLVGEKKACIKLTWDFEGQVPEVKIVKGASGTRKGGAKGGGNPQKFSMTSEALLEKFGGEKYKDTGRTFQEIWDSTTDKNARYTVRKALIKLEQA